MLFPGCKEENTLIIQPPDGILLLKSLDIRWNNPDVDQYTREAAEQLLTDETLALAKGKLMYNGKVIRQSFHFAGNTLMSIVMKAFQQAITVAAPNPLCYYQDFVNVGNNNQAVSFVLCGIPLEMGKNKYVKWQNTSKGLSYGEIRAQVNAYHNDILLARKVQNALKLPGLAAPGNPNDQSDNLGGLLAGVLGVAEPARNLLAYPILLMFLDLVLQGRRSWASGLGPDETNRNSLSIDERAIYFGKGVAEVDAEVNAITDQQAGIVSKDSPGLRWLKKYIIAFDLTDLDIRKRVLGEGNYKSISALGGALSMVGAETADSADASKDSPLRSLVPKKSGSIAIAWFQQKLQAIEASATDPNDANYATMLPIWRLFGNEAKQERLLVWLVKEHLLVPIFPRLAAAQTNDEFRALLL
jgi:hypothetical protein